MGFYHQGTKDTKRHQEKPEEVQSLVEVLCRCFPSFEAVLAEDSREQGEYYPSTCHSVFLSFNPHFENFASKATEGQLKAFANFLNQSVAEGGWKENLVSTAFLEHLHQISSATDLRKYLSSAAKVRMHA